ncbi:MAG TPA: ADP-ribosylglycohydrolase family protein [Anaerolineales bacterium]|nr:ADP-ribosylglycohydrolase family protein [Anaerolineales bacterium]
MEFPPNYYEHVYAGVLGKIIGVYLGRPFEGWTYERILEQLGEIKYYVHDRRDLPLHNHQLVVTDDDISGTFTFLRALPDYSNSLDLTPAQIGQTWLNYIIEQKTVLWWGGLGNSTEHTAYLRLKGGIQAPQSGFMALNGKVVSEQIGAQIFIDGWGLIAPGDPALAVDLARRAASVSHDGEAIYGAQVIAALIAQAFTESDLDKLLDTATTFIPADSIINRLIADIRDWHAVDPDDWHAARARLAAQYGYDKYGGNCHIVPNHGLVMLSLLYSQGDFSKAQTIVNTCGWDTDCNAANVGCILGVRNGLAAFDGEPDWRGPVADQLYLPTADGGRAISDALRETDFILATAYAIHGQQWTPPKDGARFHFSLPGSMQGFSAQDDCIRLDNTPHPTDSDQRVLTLHYRLNSNGMSALCTPTFIPPEAMDLPGYGLLASPTLYPGQIVRAEVLSNGLNTNPVNVGPFIQSYGEADQLISTMGPVTQLLPGEITQLEWQIPDLGGAPTAQVGIAISSDEPSEGILHLDHLTWDGSPHVTFRRPATKVRMWKRQWVDAADYFEEGFEAFRVIQNRGRGLVMTGAREWMDYSMQATITPHLAKAFGLAVRVQGLERYYALLLCNPNTIQLVKRLDGEVVLTEGTFAWEFGQPYHLQITVQGNHILAYVNETMVFKVEDSKRPLSGGGIALVCEEGRVGIEQVSVEPAN